MMKLSLATTYRRAERLTQLPHLFGVLSLSEKAQELWVFPVLKDLFVVDFVLLATHISG